MLSPFNRGIGQTLTTDIPGLSVDESFIAHFEVSAANAVAADTDGVLAAVTDTGSQQVKTTGLTNPAVPRNITATAGGTAEDIKAIRVTIEGYNIAGEKITEQLPAFTVNTAGTVEGSKAFASVTKVTIPAHDGNGATTEIGWGNKLGLPFKSAHNTVLAACLNDVRETTAPTVVASATDIDGNTVTLNSALNGSKVDVYLFV